MTVPPEPGPSEESSPALVLRDEEGTEFAFHPVRALRDGTDVSVLADREGAKTLHVLKREGDFFGLVRDAETLGRVALRLEILRRAMEGEGRDLLFLIPSDEPERAIAAEVKGGGRIEFPPDDVLTRLRSHLDGLAARRGQRSPS